MSCLTFYTCVGPTHDLAERLMLGADVRTQFGVARQIKKASRQMGERKRDDVVLPSPQVSRRKETALYPLQNRDAAPR